MNKIYQYSLLLFAMVLGLVACSDDDENEYVPATVSGSQVFFSNQLQTAYEISPEATTFTVPIQRGDTQGELTVPLSVEQSEGSIFSVPQAVTFADGEAQANIVVSYDPANIVYGDYATINIAIADANLTTPYGLSSCAITAGVTAWVDYGTAVYREDIVSTWYSIGHPVYEVKIQKNTVHDGLYRLVNPYGKELGDALEEDDWVAEYYDSSKDYYLEIDATDPNAVYVNTAQTGLIIDPESGMLSTSSLVAYYLNRGNTLEELKADHPEYFGTLEDGIITMPAGTLLIAEEFYNGGAWSTANRNALFTVALPGSTIADYSLSIAYAGRFTDASDTDYARLSFTFGEDVESVKYVVVPSGEDIDATIDGITLGTVEADEISEDATVEVALEETGKYAVVAVIYAGGEAVGSEVYEFRFQSSKDGAITYTWTPAYTGTYQYGYQDLTGGQAEFFYSGEEDVILYACDQDDSRYKVLPWGEEGNEGGLEFVMDDEGNLVVEEQYTGYTDEVYGPVYATDLLTYGVGGAEASYYQGGKFYFLLAYHDNEGPWTYQADVLTLTGVASAEARPAKAPKAWRGAAAKHVKPFKMLRNNDKALR